MLKFGTDGVRGVANVELTPELALALGRAAVRVLGGDRFAIGRDTRRSGPLLEAALAAGLASEGADVDRARASCPRPRWPGGRRPRARPAAMVSASHNPFADNGIKLFAAGGRKLADDVEERLEAELQRLLVRWRPTERPRARRRPGDTVPAGAAVGRIAPAAGDRQVHEGYAAAVTASIDGRRLDGLRVVVDCANGSASVVAPRVLRDLGVDVARGPRRARRHQHQRRLRVDPRRRPGRRRSSSAVPISAWPSTATPTGC